MNDGYVIETAGLFKAYNGVDALRGLDLQVPRGSIFGFLGKNGAGKTTTIKVLLGMTYATRGRATVFGLPSDRPASGVAIRRRTGFVSEDKDLIDSMTVDQIVAFTKGFYPKWRGDLETKYRRSFDLPADRSVKKLSRGMRTKLALLVALCRGVELLILDEPMSGLDPAVSEEVLQALVRHVGDEGATVFLSSHQLSDVEQIADHIAVINRGQIAVSGALDDIRERFCRAQLVFDGEAPAGFSAPGVLRTRRTGRVLDIVATNGAAAIKERAREAGASNVDVAPLTLKEIFLESVNEEN